MTEIIDETVLPAFGQMTGSNPVSPGTDGVFAPLDQRADNNPIVSDLRGLWSRCSCSRHSWNMWQCGCSVRWPGSCACRWVPVNSSVRSRQILVGLLSRCPSIFSIIATALSFPGRVPAICGNSPLPPRAARPSSGLLPGCRARWRYQGRARYRAEHGHRLIGLALEEVPIAESVEPILRHGRCGRVTLEKSAVQLGGLGRPAVEQDFQRVRSPVAIRR